MNRENGIVIRAEVPETIVVISPEVMTEISTVMHTLAGVQQVTSVEVCEGAAPTYKAGSLLLAQIEKERKAVKAPLLAAGKMVDQAAKDATEKLAAEVNRVGTLIGMFQAEQKRKAEEAKRAEEERLRRAARINPEESVRSFEDAAALAPKSAGPIPAVPTGTGVAMQKIKYLIIEDETKIPREYLVPDEGRILNAMKSGAEVPGCRIGIREIPKRTGR